jgi:hypothetical protein
VKDCFVDGPTTDQVLYDDALEESRRHAAIPNAIGIYHDDRAAAAHTEARRFTALHSLWTEEQTVPLQQRGKQLVQLAAALIGRTKPTDAHEHMSTVRLHGRQ